MAIEIKDPMKIEALRYKLRIALKNGDWKLQVNQLLIFSRTPIINGYSG